MEEKIDTTECDREPIHIPGFIQPFGVLIALHTDRRTITAVSDNSYEFLGKHASELVGSAFSDLIEAKSRLRHISELSDLKEMEKHSGSMNCAVRGTVVPLDYTVHLRYGVTVIELELPSPIDQSYNLQSDASRVTIERLQSSKDLTELCQVAVEEVQRLTGYERVMMYRFDEQWNGNVIAEKLSRPSVDTYLGHWFPAEDIPRQARQLFYENWIRMIPDAGHLVPVKIVSDKTIGPLDLTLSLLRSPSPIHIEYLKNMGVGASLTISVRRDEKLWGLIACHHETPKLSKRHERTSYEFIGKLVSLLINTKEIYEDHDYRQKLRGVHKTLVQYMSQEEDFVRGLIKNQPNLLDLTNSTGAAAALYFEGKWSFIGKVPKLHQIQALVKWLKQVDMENGFFCTNALPRQWPNAMEFKDVAAGLIAISIPKSEDNFILWSRPEILQSVTWAGNPDKSLSRDANTLRLHPRKSFTSWKQEVRDTSLPWRPAEIEAAHELRRSVIELDLERQFCREREARAEADLERRRVEFLADVSKRLSSSLDFATILDVATTLAVNGFCDWCVISLGERGSLTRQKIRHATAEGQRIADELIRFPQTVAGLRELQTSESTLVSPVEKPWLAALAGPGEYLTFLQDTLRIRSYIAVQLISRGKFLGIFEFVNSDNQRLFTTPDLKLAEELTRRAAVAIDNSQLYQDARELYTEARKASRLKEEVLAVVSHDLKNPVRSISFSVDLAKRLKKEDPRFTEKLDGLLTGIDTSARQMRNLIQDLLDAAKLEAKAQLDIEKIEVDVKSLVEETTTVLTAVAQERGQTLLTKIVENCVLSCDPRRISQVLSNIIGNAIKFSEEGTSVEITVRACHPTCLFSIRDNGPGIPAELLEQVFERFWQGSRQAREGLGLGLAIARGIVEAHGGRIWAESTLNEGTTFHFEIPNPVATC